MIILHIGLEKTGTSAIQDYLKSIRQPLYSHGVLYPFVPHPHGHHALATACGFSVPVDVGDVLEHFQSECARWKGIVLISSENFSIYGTRDKIAQLAHTLAATDHAIKILMYYREKTQWLHSVFHERKRWGMKESFDEFASSSSPHYEKLPSLWRAEFNDVHVKRYGPNMCRIFMKELGLPFAPNGPEKLVHKSLHDSPNDWSWGWTSPELAGLAST